MEVIQKRPVKVARRLAASLFAAVGALMLYATSALAATSAQLGYSTPGGTVQSEVGGKVQTLAEPQTHTAAVHSVSTAAAHGPQLPFTGLDVLAIVVVGLALLAVGFGIRKIAAQTAAQ